MSCRTWGYHASVTGGPESAASQRTSPTPSRSPRLTSLDGLRGVAALIVLLHHCLLPIPDFAAPLYGGSGGSWSWYLNSPLHVLTAGTEAVVVFFVLSGLVLTLQAVAGTRRFSWRAYYPSRLLRLYVPVVAAVVWSLLLITVFPRGGLSDDPSLWLREHAEPTTLTTAIKDCLLLGGTSNLDGPLWSLRWEVLFSLLLPLYVWAAVALRKVWLLAAAGAIVATGLVIAVGIPGLQYLPMFAIGALFAVRRDALASAAHRVNEAPSGRWIWAALTAFAILGITANWTVGHALSGHGLSMMLVAAGATAWVFVAFGCPTAGRLLNTGTVQWLGRVSFSLYLTHEPIVVAIAQLLPQRLAGLTGLIAVPLSFLAAAVFFRVAEAPAHRLSQRVRSQLRAH